MHSARPVSRATSRSSAHESKTLLNLTNELHQLQLGAISLKVVNPALAASVRQFADRVSNGVGNWPVWNALATLRDETTSPSRPLQASVFHIVETVKLGLLHSTITSVSSMAPAFAAINHIINFGSVTNALEQAHGPSSSLPAPTVDSSDSAGSSPVSFSVSRHRLLAPSSSSSASSASYAARYAVPAFTSAPRSPLGSAKPSSTQPRLDESYAVFNAALLHLSRVRPAQPLPHDSSVEIHTAVEKLEAAVPTSAAWEALSVVKPRGALPGEETSFQQQVLERLHVLVVELGEGTLWEAELIRLQVSSILGIIDEGEKHARWQQHHARSLAKRSPVRQLVSARTAARYRVSQEDLARRWT
ncbi:hypothetical protein JCM3775_006024 [Rhodotorula graminis]